MPMEFSESVLSPSWHRDSTFTVDGLLPWWENSYSILNAYSQWNWRFPLMNLGWHTLADYRIPTTANFIIDLYIFRTSQDSHSHAISL